MSTIGVIQIHDEINRTNGQCCCICFRPASERRLVEPECLSNLISKLVNVVRFKNKLQVCYICEALAKSAARFVKAVELAAEVNELFAEITVGQWMYIAKCLGPNGKSPRPTKLNEECPPWRALRLERELRSCPRFELYRTDTLVVSGGADTATSKSALTTAYASAPASATTPVRSQARTDAVVVMQHEDPISTMLPVVQPILPMMTQVVLPNLPQAAAVTSTLSQISIDPDQKHMRVLNKDTNEAILHPMVTGVDGNIYVPSLQLQILDNGILKSVDNSHIQNLLPSTYPQPLKTPNLNSNNLNSTNLNSTNHSSTVTNTRNSTNLNSTVTNKRNSANSNSSNSSSANLNSKVTNSREMTSVISEKSRGKYHNYNFLMSQMKLKNDKARSVNTVEIIKMNDLNIVLNVDDCDDNASTKKRKHSELDQTLSDVRHILNENAQGSCEISYELIDDEDDASSGNQVTSNGNRLTASGNHSSVTYKSGAGGNRVSPTGNRALASGNRALANGNRALASGNQVTACNSAVKEPVLRTDRTVDWEDKIPMDVISFMDATDPNPQERIMQPVPMGFISDVRSVPDQPENIECIDLC